tara:strand:- start:2088 stop:2417 length:330 start_codon:yes stop_codon:yes gene_type:complete
MTRRNESENQMSTLMSNEDETFERFMDAHGKQLMGLKWRWMDECKYEDFCEYKKIVRGIVEGEGLRFLNWTKRGRLTFEDANGSEFTIVFLASGSVKFRVVTKRTATNC